MELKRTNVFDRYKKLTDTIEIQIEGGKKVMEGFDGEERKVA